MKDPWEPGYVPPKPKKPKKPKPPVRDEAYYESVREQLDAVMFANPNTAHIIREAPLSQRFKKSPTIRGKKP